MQAKFQAIRAKRLYVLTEKCCVEEITEKLNEIKQLRRKLYYKMLL